LSWFSKTQGNQLFFWQLEAEIVDNSTRQDARPGTRNVKMGISSAVLAEIDSTGKLAGAVFHAEGTGGNLLTRLS